MVPDFILYICSLKYVLVDYLLACERIDGKKLKSWRKMVNHSKDELMEEPHWFHHLPEGAES